MCKAWPFRIAGLGLIAFAMSAAAGDGALEINQACALDGGCFSGDSGGFPVTLTRPGRYILTSDLDVSGQADPQNVVAISPEAADIYLDLNGFAIRGPTVCSSPFSGAPVDDCTPAGLGAGVAWSGNGSVPINMTVRNGSVVGMGGEGLIMQDHARIIDVTARSNAFTGITVGIASQVRDSAAVSNGSEGFVQEGQSGTSGSTFERVRAYGNGADGLAVNGGLSTSVIGGVFNNNGQDGIAAGNATVIGATASQNAVFGFQLTSGLVKDSIAIGNGNVAVYSFGRVGVGGNTFRFNNSSGDESNFGSSSSGEIVGIDANVCDLDTVCN